MKDQEKTLCIDLFCGRGGWARGFLGAGFRVVGFDIEDMGSWYRGSFSHRVDVRDSPNQGFGRADAEIMGEIRPVSAWTRIYPPSLPTTSIQPY